MTGRTHDLAAFTALNTVIISQPLPQMPFSTALVAFGACFIGGLAPDLDTPTSEIWHKLPAGTFLGKMLHPFLGGHRLISHSLLGLFIFGWISKYLLTLASSTLLVNMNLVWLAFMIGYISHLVMDAFTHDGVPLLFPLPLHLGIPPMKALRMKTGGILEKALVFPGLLILNGYLFYTFQPIYLQLIHQIIK
jgi:inner membrane protein